MTSPATNAAFARGAPVDLLAHQIRKPVWRLIIDGTDVSREISPMVLSVSYTDHVGGKSDDIEVKLENRDHRWTAAWYPTKGDAVELMIGYDGEPLLPCGRFEIDHLASDGPPDTFTIKCLAAGIIPALRTKKSRGFEGQKLKDIAAKIAMDHGFTLVGPIDETIHIARSTQYNETDLAYLTRIAEVYGYVFSVRGMQLVFYERGSLEGANVIWTVKREQAKRYPFEDATHQLYRACHISSADPVGGQIISETVFDDTVKKGDVLRIANRRLENAAQAKAQAAIALKYTNAGNAKARLTLIGNPKLVAGNTVDCQGFGVVDAKYLIQTARHKITRDSGYDVELEMTKCGAP